MQRIAGRESQKAAEVAIGGPDLGDAVTPAQGADSGVVDHGFLDRSVLKVLPEDVPMGPGLGEQPGCWCRWQSTAPPLVDGFANA